MKNALSSFSPISTFLIALIGVVAVSCERVVDIDLNTSSPRIVIEGNISSEPGPYFVTVSQTVNFNATNSFPPVRNANIVLRDNVGNSDSMIEISPGTYRTSTMQGVPGRTYTLTVTTDGKEFVAISTIPPPITIDSLTVQTVFVFGDRRKIVNVHFQDPANIKNYYRFVERKNGIEQKFIFLYDDRVGDGGAVASSLLTQDDTLRTGDAVQILLQCIDKGAFDYFRTMAQAGGSGGGGPQATSPANPVSNISNGALGYFNACAVRTRSITIP